MTSNPPPNPFEPLQAVLNSINGYISSSQWSSLLIVMDVGLFSLFSLIEQPSFSTLKEKLPKDYPAYFLVAGITIFFLAILIKVFNLDRPISQRCLKFFLLMVGTIALIFFITFLLNLGNNPGKIPIVDNLSWGEKGLIDIDKYLNEGSECKDSMKDGKISYEKGTQDGYETSERYYQEAIKNCNDVIEAPIYLQNAKAMQSHNPFRIVVSVPISRNKGKEDSTEILRGVAIAQKEWNKSHENKMMVVGIADDGHGKQDGSCGNNKDSGECKAAKDVAENLVKNKYILAVIGHFSSDATEAVSKIYKDGKLVLSSPTSTAIRNNIKCDKDALCLNPYIFRTAVNDSIATKTLYAKIEKSNIKKIAIIYEGESKYSNLFKTEFRKIYEYKRGIIANKGDNKDNVCNFSATIGFNSEECIQLVSQTGRNSEKSGFLLIPSTKNSLDVIKILNQNKKSQKLPLFGSDSMYQEPFILKEKDEPKSRAEGMLVFVSWHKKDDKCNNESRSLECRAAQLFDMSKKVDTNEEFKSSGISWRVKTSYDAAQAVFQGLDKTDKKCQFNLLNKSECLRTNLKDVLLANEGDVKFDGNGDRKDEVGVVVKVDGGKFVKVD
jgi:ABC-type branched-subunit amino acid transport system substrate-binding protein